MLLSKSFGPSGVHPDDYKYLTNRKNIESADVPNVAYIPVNQHIGAPAKIIVRPGDVVSEGQIIAKPDGDFSAYVHASIPGTVRSIEEVYLPNGKKSKAVVIEMGGEFIKSGRMTYLSDWQSMTREELIDKILKSGVVGMGGATLPLQLKLNPPEGIKIDTLIVNAAECEPYLSCDHRIMLEKTEGLLQGISIIHKILGDLKNIYIGVENNKRDAQKKLKILANNQYPYKVVPLKVKYPQGDEKQLIKSITGKVVPIGQFPFNIGIVVLNVATVLAVKEAILNDKPLIERVVTVSGAGIRQPKNIVVKIGTPIAEVIDECGGLTDNVDKVVVGGPMMGFAQKDLNAPVTKGTSGIICLIKEESSHYKKQTICINCGKCVTACAFGLTPTRLSKLIEYHKYDVAKDEGLLNCKECGACTWVCPAKVPLVQQFRFGKKMILKPTNKERN